MDKDAIFANVSDVFVVPTVKTNKLAVDHLEKLIAFQMSALQSYVDIGVGQLKAAAEVSSPEDAQDFFKKQLEVSAKLRQKVLDDLKALTDLGNGFRDDYTKLAKENVNEVKSKVENVKKAA